MLRVVLSTAIVYVGSGLKDQYTTVIPIHVSISSHVLGVSSFFLFLLLSNFLILYFIHAFFIHHLIHTRRRLPTVLVNILCTMKCAYLYKLSVSLSRYYIVILFGEILISTFILYRYVIVYAIFIFFCSMNITVKHKS